MLPPARAPKSHELIESHGQRWVIHVDLDAFFAAVEVLDDPTLVGQPLVVGGTGPRAVVASASYQARRFGIRSAMPISRARQLCSQLVVRPGRFDRYSEVSREFHRVLTVFSETVESVGLDEAYLEIPARRDPVDVAGDLKSMILDRCSLQCGIGVGPNKLVAKLASKAAKPKANKSAIVKGRGVVVIKPADAVSFVRSHEVSDLPGVGPATLRRLAQIGVLTVEQLAEQPLSMLSSRFGPKVGAHLAEMALGQDSRTVGATPLSSSVSHEVTFPVDQSDPALLAASLENLAHECARKLGGMSSRARTVAIKVRFSDFSTVTRSRTVFGGISEGVQIAAVAAELFSLLELVKPVRLIGVAISGIEAEGGVQLTLGDSANGALKTSGVGSQVRAVLHEINSHFGAPIISIGHTEQSD